MIFANKDYPPLSYNESVLDCLLRHEINIDYSCKSGNCQACMLKCLQGKVDTQAQKGLKATAVEQGFFLPANKKQEQFSKPKRSMLKNFSARLF